MESVDYLWKVVIWGFGSCITGFLFLLGIVLKTTHNMTQPVQEIRDALIGTLYKPGLITKFHRVEEDVENIKAHMKTTYAPNK